MTEQPKGATPSNERPPSSSHLPLPDHDTEEYWAAAAEHRLICRVDGQGRLHHYPRRRTPGTLEPTTGWRVLAGLGTVYSFTVIHQAASSAFRPRVPYVVALIDLDEGVRMLSNVEADPSEVHIGQRVEVCWREDQDVTIPVFRPVETP